MPFHVVKDSSPQPKKMPKKTPAPRPVRTLTFGQLLLGESYSAEGTPLKPENKVRLQFLTVGIEMLRDLAIENGMPITKE